jgi:RNA polymerase sigma-70 factor (ECF subfamily)
MGEMDDTALLGRARRGDETAVSQLFARHQRQLFRYATYMGGGDNADDIVQDTFLAVLRQKERTDTLTGSVIGYLIGIARHLIMKQRAPLSAVPPAIEDAMDLPTDEPNAFDRLVMSESVDHVRAAVKSLPPAYREVVVLCELEDIDYADAAAMMQCPVGTVRSRLHRARALLAAKLARTGSEAGSLDPADRREGERNQ